MPDRGRQSPTHSQSPVGRRSSTHAVPGGCKAAVNWAGIHRCVMVTRRPLHPETESFAGLLLRHRGRTGLTQRDLAARLGTNRRSVQDWESGLSYPTGERLQALFQVLLEAGGLTLRGERAEAHELWPAEALTGRCGS